MDELRTETSPAAAIAAAMTALDAASLAARFERERVLVLDVLPEDLVSAMAREAERSAHAVRRTHVPFVRRGGAVAHPQILAACPTLTSLAASPELHRTFERVAGTALERRDARDPHASALYVYERPGDHIGWHYDDCGCVPLASFTVIVGIEDQSESRLELELFHDRGSTERLRIATRPGRIVFFAGSNARHRVTPLRRGERRVSFSFVYTKPGLRPTGVARLRQTAIDTLLYFGRRGVTAWW